MAAWCAEYGVEIWSYCLMPNHVHLVAVPRSEDGLRRAIGEAHRRYTRRYGQRFSWSDRIDCTVAIFSWFAITVLLLRNIR